MTYWERWKAKRDRQYLMFAIYWMDPVECCVYAGYGGA